MFSYSENDVFEFQQITSDIQIHIIYSSDN